MGDEGSGGGLGLWLTGISVIEYFNCFSCFDPRGGGGGEVVVVVADNSLGRCRGALNVCHSLQSAAGATCMSYGDWNIPKMFSMEQ